FWFLDSDHFIPELVCGMLEALWQQADYLTQFGGGGNWLVCEKSALVTVGVVYPEFLDSAKWLQLGWEVLSRELETQIYPDGAQVELTPHYHTFTLGSFRQAYDIAERNSVAIPPAYRGHLERMYEYLMYVVKPDGFIPMFNDSDHDNVRSWLRDGAQRFGRSDMLYLASGGQEGTPPGGPSHAFPWAGQYIMRSGWTRDDVYLALDAGPFGLGHQHEDKLTVDVWAYGQELILDPGRYTYAGGKWRPYFVSTHSHSTLLVNGQGQQRRRTPPSTWVPREPRLNRWVSTEAFDFAVGSYEDGYDGIENLIHVRKILFVKPRYFLITDLLLPYTSTDREMEATVQWQLARPGAQLDPQTLAVHSLGPQANVLLIPADPENLTVTLHEGEEDPPAGWIGWSLHKALKEPATLVRYSRRGVPPLRFDTLLVPYKGDEPPSPVFAQYPFPEAAREYMATEGPIGSNPVNLNTPEVTVKLQQPVPLRLCYGYAAGSGFLFETPPTEPTTLATLSLQDPRPRLPYVYEVLAKGGDDWSVVQHGTIRIEG
ncbi:MAG: alginate lyase family protein, partial [Candidatus Zipacnadales bacterium]